MAEYVKSVTDSIGTTKKILQKLPTGIFQIQQHSAAYARRGYQIIDRDIIYENTKPPIIHGTKSNITMLELIC